MFGGSVFLGLDPSSPCICTVINPGSVQANLMTFKVTNVNIEPVSLKQLDFFFTYDGGGRLLNNINLYDGATLVAPADGIAVLDGVLIPANTVKLFVLRADYAGPVGAHVTPSITGGLTQNISTGYEHHIYHGIVGIPRTLSDGDPTSVPEPGTFVMFVIGAGIITIALKRQK